MLALFVAVIGVAPTNPLPFVTTVNLYPDDLVFAVITAATALRFVAAPHRAIRQAPVLLFFGLVALALARGVMAYSLKAAGVQARPYFYFASAALYCSSFGGGGQRLKQASRLWAYACAVLIGIAVLGWVRLALGLSWATPLFPTAVLDDRIRFRVLDHAPALFLCQGAALIAVLRPFRPRYLYIPAVVLLAFVTILLQHRTVWVVGLAMLGAFVLRHSGASIRRGIPATRVVLLIAGVLLLSAGVVWLIHNDTDIVSRTLRSSVSETQHSNNTFSWRVEGWRALLQDWADQSTLEGVVLGWSFGPVLRRYVDGVWDASTSHNFYVEMLLRLGVSGFIALLAMYMIPFARLRDRQDPQTRALMLLWISQIVYYMTYPPTFDQGIVLGLLISLSGRRIGSPISAVLRIVPRPVHAVGHYRASS
ncbi:MAG: O-antigen ligase family protein [Acidobacteriia bacterium]|nr:O-antigen ligase family protein [Terriglobia bacterium]